MQMVRRMKVGVGAAVAQGGKLSTVVARARMALMVLKEHHHLRKLVVLAHPVEGREVLIAGARMELKGYWRKDLL